MIEIHPALLRYAKDNGRYKVFIQKVRLYKRKCELYKLNFKKSPVSLYRSLFSDIDFEKYICEENKQKCVDIFKKFLETNEIYNHFINYINIPFLNQQINHRINKLECGDKLEYLFANCHPMYYILFAFSWAKTVQGYTFWAAMAEKYKKYLMNELLKQWKL